MNTIFMQNMQYQMAEVSNNRNPLRQTYHELSPARKEYLEYILKHGEATGEQLRRHCINNTILPSMALRQNIRNGTVIFTMGATHRLGKYTIASGITRRALRLTDGE